LKLHNKNKRTFLCLSYKSEYKKQKKCSLQLSCDRRTAFSKNRLMAHEEVKIMFSVLFVIRNVARCITRCMTSGNVSHLSYPWLYTCLSLHCLSQAILFDSNFNRSNLTWTFRIKPSHTLWETRVNIFVTWMTEDFKERLTSVATYALSLHDGIKRMFQKLLSVCCITALHFIGLRIWRPHYTAMHSVHVLTNKSSSPPQNITFDTITQYFPNGKLHLPACICYGLFCGDLLRRYLVI
jgi:hypothetical protein